MRGKVPKLITGLLLAIATQAQAKSVIVLGESAGGGPSIATLGVLQCVPFARDTSGIRLYGDAHTWWSQAQGKYGRGRAPRPGAVMAIRPHGNSTLGHVATVSRIIDARTILISHANWSAPGKIERNVKATDVSPTNDWSEVRVWYAPIHNLGGAHWPVSGFIYKDQRGNAREAKPAKVAAKFTLTKFVPSKTVQVRFGSEPEFVGKAPARFAPVRSKAVHMAKADTRKDPIGAIIARAR